MCFMAQIGCLLLLICRAKTQSRERKTIRKKHRCPRMTLLLIWNKRMQSIIQLDLEHSETESVNGDVWKCENNVYNRYKSQIKPKQSVTEEKWLLNKDVSLLLIIVNVLVFILNLTKNYIKKQCWSVAEPDPLRWQSAVTVNLFHLAATFKAQIAGHSLMFLKLQCTRANLVQQLLWQDILFLSVHRDPRRYLAI